MHPFLPLLSQPQWSSPLSGRSYSTPAVKNGLWWLFLLVSQPRAISEQHCCVPFEVDASRRILEDAGVLVDVRSTAVQWGFPGIVSWLVRNAEQQNWERSSPRAPPNPAGSCPRSVRVPQYTNMSQFFSDHNSVFRAHSVVHLHSLGGEEWMKRSVGSFARKTSACGSTG